MPLSAVRQFGYPVHPSPPVVKEPIVATLRTVMILIADTKRNEEQATEPDQRRLLNSWLIHLEEVRARLWEYIETQESWQWTLDRRYPSSRCDSCDEPMLGLPTDKPEHFTNRGGERICMRTYFTFCGNPICEQYQVPKNSSRDYRNHCERD